ncbi:Hypothetical protein PENO1_050280 [Penicillium occitanis (nom. inval.)]|nr:Hypothetical protein PENO1_050280 [Penicillium occitanis (nom. inval.)]PCH01776.1 hypothetical protein PENOC_046700 [Penicillium occitanis (nom. inval.)]
MGEIGEHYRDLREYRKRKRDTQIAKANKKTKRSDEPPRRRCWDWMVTTGNCHYAKNRSSFKEYRRVGKSVPNGIIEGTTTFIAGVGTVELKVQTSREEGSLVRTLVLEDVLHIPDARCNGFSVAMYHTVHGGSTRLGREPSGSDEEYQPLWCSSEFKGLNKLVLAGNPQGESYLGDAVKMLSMYIGDEDHEGIVGPRGEREVSHEDCGDWEKTTEERNGGKAMGCHYAKDRESFSTYGPVNKTVNDGNTFVAGIGDVELQVKSSPKRGSLVKTLKLENVPHIPDAFCNGFNINAWLMEGR